MYLGTGGNEPTSGFLRDENQTNGLPAGDDVFIGEPLNSTEKPMRATVSTSKVVQIPIQRIVADHERVQPRTKMDEDAIVDYRNVIDDLPPIDVFLVQSEDRYYVTEGFHRHHVRVESGARKLACVVVGEGTLEDAILKATANEKNRRNGVRLSRSDKRRSVRLTLLVPGTESWTTARVADHCGVSRGLVDEIRSEMGSAGIIDPSADRVRKDGKPLGQPANRQAGRAVVDGVEQDDPPEVAAAREAGSIPNGVVPVVSTASFGRHDDVSEPDVETDEEDDEAYWVDSLPLASVLQGDPLTSFRREAAFYRRFNETRKASTTAFVGIKTGIGREYPGAKVTPYEDRLSRSFKVNGPAEWVVCADSEFGGCDGTGADILGNRCMKCKGAGYLVT